MYIQKHIQAHGELISALDKNLYKTAAFMAEAIADCFMSGGKLYICGGGLSGFLARYAVTVFATKCSMARPPLPAIYLSSDISFLAYSENISEIFEKQVNSLMTEADLLWGIISENKSDNVIKALRAAAHSGIKSIALAGADNGNIQGVADIYLTVPGKDPLRNQEVHLLFIHAICDMVDRIMFSPGDAR